MQARPLLRMWASLRLPFLQQCLRNERHHGVCRFQRGMRELLPLCWKWELAAGARECSPSPFFMRWMSRDELLRRYGEHWPLSKPFIFAKLSPYRYIHRLLLRNTVMESERKIPGTVGVDIGGTLPIYRQRRQYSQAETLFERAVVLYQILCNGA